MLYVCYLAIVMTGRLFSQLIVVSGSIPVPFPPAWALLKASRNIYSTFTFVTMSVCIYKEVSSKLWLILLTIEFKYNLSRISLLP